MSDKAIILIDGGYYDHINNFYRDEIDSSGIDIYQLSLYLCDWFDVKLLRTKFYHTLPYMDDDPTEEQQSRRQSQQSFFDTLDSKRKCQFEEKGRVKLDHADCPECGKHFRTKSQKGTDVGIAVELVEMACDKNAPDAFILISGDEDLKHAVRAAKDNHANVFLGYAYKSSHDLYSAQELRNEVDHKMNIATADFLPDIGLN
jgi:uncharacterized LabA/DUF88 family protein